MGEHRSARLSTTFGRALHEQRRALVGWAAGLGTTVILELSLFPTVRATDLSKLVASYPEAVKQLFSVGDFSSGPGYVRAELFSLVVPMLLVVLGVLWGSDAIAGEEERHTIDLLLTHPISRRRALVEKAAAVAAGIFVVSTVVLAALVVGDVAFHVRVGAARLASGVVATALLAVLYALVALALGAATGRRGAARGVSAALAVAAYLVSSLAPLVSWLRPWRTASPWYHALGVDPIAHGLSPSHVAVLVVLAGLVLAAGAIGFDRRDLGT